MLFLFTYPGIFGALCFTLSRLYDAPECEAVSGETRGEAQEEEISVLEDTLDLLDELLELLEDSGEAGAEDAAAILSEAADYMGDVLQ